MILPRAYLILVGTAAAVIVAAGIGATAWLIAPAFLAWVIVVVIAPVGHRLRACRAAGLVLATAVLVVLVYGVVVVMAGVVVLSAARLATVLPQYAAEADGLRRGLGTLLGTYGIGPDQVRERAGRTWTSARSRATSGCCSRASPGWRPTWSSCSRCCCSSASRRAGPTPGWPC